MNNKNNWLALYNTKTNASVEKKLLSLNTETKLYGLALTPDVIKYIVEARIDTLKDERRIESSENPVVIDIVKKLEDSDYISQRNLAETVSYIHGLFMTVKNDTLDLADDTTVLDMIVEAYNTYAEGDLSVLEYFTEEAVHLFNNIRGEKYESLKSGSHYNYKRNEYLRDFEENLNEMDDMSLNLYWTTRGSNLFSELIPAFIECALNSIKTSYTDVMNHEALDLFDIDGYDKAELLAILDFMISDISGGYNTSLSYGATKELMCSILYYIHECECYGNLPAGNISAWKSFELGRKIINEKAYQLKKLVNALPSVARYGIFALTNTVDNLKAFVKDYKSNITPQYDSCALSYTLLTNDKNLDGLDKLIDYTKNLCLELEFLNRFPTVQVTNLLYRTDADYATSNINAVRVVFRHLTGLLMIGQRSDTNFTDLEYQALLDFAGTYSLDQLTSLFNDVIRKMTTEIWSLEDKNEMMLYLENEASAFANALVNSDIISVGNVLV